MKRPESSDTPPVNQNGEFLEEEMGMEGDEDLDLIAQVTSGASGLCEKKRRLSVEQVKALEKNFEVENKLEPERKVKLAMELGLQPRQVAVWFQNRRARWKTKQLERDYTVLKSNYDALKLTCAALRCDKDTLLLEIKELKSKLGMVEQPSEPPDGNKSQVEDEEPPELILKDGSSDSDSSAIFNDENSAYNLAISEHCVLQDEERNEGLFVGFHQYAEERSSNFPFCYQPPQYLRPEDNAFFSDDSPAIPWYCSEQWS